MIGYKNVYTLNVKHSCCDENRILVADTSRTFIGYKDQISDWLDMFLISDYMSLSEDCPENGYIRTDITLRIQCVDAYGDVAYDRESRKFLKDEWDKFNSDKEIINFVDRWIFDVTYNINRACNAYMKKLIGRKYDYHMVEEISQN